MRTGRDLGMHRDHRRSMFREETGDGDLSLEPLPTLPWPIEIRYHARDESLRKPEHERIPILQDLATIRRNAVGKSALSGGADGALEVIRCVHGKQKAA
jgi:hypothetical protein